MIYYNGLDWVMDAPQKPITTMDKAIAYCEDYGICEFHLEGETLVYYISYRYEHMTYRAVVNLDTREEKRTPLKNYYKPYKSLIGGKYQANLG